MTSRKIYSYSLDYITQECAAENRNTQTIDLAAFLDILLRNRSKLRWRTLV